MNLLRAKNNCVNCILITILFEDNFVSFTFFVS